VQQLRKGQQNSTLLCNSCGKNNKTVRYCATAADRTTKQYFTVQQLRKRQQNSTLQCNSCGKDNKTVLYSATAAERTTKQYFTVQQLRKGQQNSTLLCNSCGKDNKTASLTTALSNVSSRTLNGNAVTVKYCPASLKRHSGRQDTLQQKKTK